MKRAILLFILTIAAMLVVQGQPIAVLEGGVSKKETNAPLEGVIVTLVGVNQKFLGYQMSDTKGKFKFSIASSDTVLLLTANLLGYKAVTLELENKSQQLAIKLEEDAINLREVVVKARPIYQKKDTLVYSVSSFKDIQDRTIGDVLKKMPGIEVAESGAIKYKGESINKFYVEGLDLLERKYGMVTNNLTADAIGSVEVMEDHQPVKMLDGFSSTGKAAINLKLKDSKKTKPFGSIEAKMGVDEDDLLWCLNLLAMQISTTRQTLFMYKTNNQGIDSSTEFKDQLYMNPLESIEPDLLNYTSVANLPLNRKRYLFNQSHLLTYNNLWKLSESSDTKININYLHDKIEERNEQISSYYDEDNPINLNEYSLIEQRVNRMDIAASYTNNSSKYFINNQLNAKLKWDKSDNRIMQDNALVGQQYHTPQFIVYNKLNLAKRIKKRVFQFHSLVRYASLPQQLVVDIDSLERTNEQSVHKSGLYTENAVEYKLLLGSVELGMDLKLKGGIENLNSDLTHHYLNADNANRMQQKSVDVTFSPKLVYKNQNGVLLRITLDFKQYNLWIKNRGVESSEGYHFIYPLPKVYFSYKINKFWGFNLNYGFNKTIGDVRDFMEAPIMHNYRIYRKSSGILAKKSSHMSGVRFNYKHPVYNLFSNVGVTYLNSRNNLLPSVVFEGVQSISSTTEQNNRTKSWIVDGYLGKYIGSIQTNLSLNGSYNNLQTERKQQNKLYPLTSEMWSISPIIRTKLSECMNVQYGVKFTHNKLSIKNEVKEMKSSTQQLSQTLYYYLSLGKCIIMVGGEHLYNKLSKDTHVNLFFADLSLRYKLKQVEFSLNWDNIFNQKKYEYTTYNLLDTYTFTRYLRPMQIMAGVTFSY